MTAMKPSDIDIEKITFSSIKTLDNGGKMLYLNYGQGMNPIYVKSPEVEIPFDPTYYPDNEDSGKYAIKFSMKDLDNNTAMQEFHHMMVSMDEHLIKKAGENSQPWFKKNKLSTETLNELYTPMVKVSKDPETGEPNGKWPDSFGFKVVKRDGKFKDFSIYDTKGVEFDVNGVTENPTDISKLLVKGSLIKVVLKCNGIWIANGKFGCTWRAEQVRIKVPEGGLREFAILSDSEDEVDDEKSRDPVAPNLVEDSTDEEEEKEEPEPKPPVEKVKKSRKVKVKKPTSQ